MEKQAVYGAGQDFVVEVLSWGSRIDREGGGIYQIETYTLRLNHVALNEYLLSEMTNCRECYPDGPEGDQQWATHKAEYTARRRAWRMKILEALGIDTADRPVTIKQLVAEFFGVVWMREVEI